MVYALLDQVFNTHRDHLNHVELTMLYVASTDVESVKPTLQRKGRDGLLLITNQPSPHLPMAGSSRPKAGYQHYLGINHPLLIKLHPVFQNPLHH